MNEDLNLILKQHIDKINKVCRREEKPYIYELRDNKLVRIWGNNWGIEELYDYSNENDFSGIYLKLLAYLEFEVGI